MIKDSNGLVGYKSGILFIAGPDGIGKGYISQKIYEALGIEEIYMVTTRPQRNKDSKKSLSEKDFNTLQNDGKLIGVHTNDNGYKYAYESDAIFNRIDTPIIMEINPVYQKYEIFVNDLKSRGFNILGFFGIIGERDYMEYNIKGRTTNISGEELVKKISMGEKIVEELQNLNKQQLATIFSASFINRETISSSIGEAILKIIY